MEKFDPKHQTWSRLPVSEEGVGREQGDQAVDTMRPEGGGAGERETKLIIKNNTLNKIQLMCLISIKLSKCQIVD